MVLLQFPGNVSQHTQCLSPQPDKLFSISGDDSSMPLWLSTPDQLILYITFTTSFIQAACTEFLLHASIVLGSGMDKK